MLRGADPDGVAGRQERLLPRRTYIIEEAMILWHIDGMPSPLVSTACCSCCQAMQLPVRCSAADAGYEKLKMFGFYLHAGIDGGSNFVVYAFVANNKAASSLFSGYRAAMEVNGRPQALRADMAFQAGVIGQDMIDNRGQGVLLVGPSTANQVVCTGLVNLQLLAVAPGSLLTGKEAGVWGAAYRKLLELYLVALCTVFPSAVPGIGGSEARCIIASGGRLCVMHSCMRLPQPQRTELGLVQKVMSGRSILPRDHLCASPAAGAGECPR